ncbi:MAG TPA: hypothetical protein PLP05_00990 [Sedimentisphaerales bacterium]|nr:hypothetical protein [Sedimentisphaerales bacterium]
MRLKLRFIFVVFYFTAVSIFTVYIRCANNKIFYRLYATLADQNQLKQQLWQKQLEFENEITPAILSEYLKENTSVEED